ncbi:hypothetical protein [Actinacidiphila glaucinigra]|uniref:hypothetical protein n=1 Tax=Actinacidiphila glaucinigra TaxID=235986 RepID=UPI00367060C8
MASMLALATPAAAHGHDANVYSEGQWFQTWLGQTHVNSDHKTGYVCDKEADGVGVYGRFKLDNGQIKDLADGDGAGNDCNNYKFTAPSGRYIVAIEAVWRGGRTSGWHDA